MKILILSPHPDDAELNCGGSIAKWKRLGHYVKVLAFSLADTKGIAMEFNNSMNALGVDDRGLFEFKRRQFDKYRQAILDKLLREPEVYDIVLIPSALDTHQDHQVIHQEGLRAFKYCTVLMYCAERNSNITIRRYVSEITDADYYRKVEALRQYKSQADRWYFKEYLEGKRIETAEYFDIYRWIDSEW